MLINVIWTAVGQRSIHGCKFIKNSEVTCAVQSTAVFTVIMLSLFYVINCIIIYYVLKTEDVKESKSVGLVEEDALNWARWRVGVGETAVRVG